MIHCTNLLGRRSLGSSRIPLLGGRRDERINTIIASFADTMIVEFNSDWIEAWVPC